MTTCCTRLAVLLFIAYPALSVGDMMVPLSHLFMDRPKTSGKIPNAFEDKRAQQAVGPEALPPGLFLRSTDLEEEDPAILPPVPLPWCDSFDRRDDEDSLGSDWRNADGTCVDGNNACTTSQYIRITDYQATSADAPIKPEAFFSVDPVMHYTANEYPQDDPRAQVAVTEFVMPDGPLEEGEEENAEAIAVFLTMGGGGQPGSNFVGMGVLASSHPTNPSTALFCWVYNHDNGKYSDAMASKYYEGANVFGTQFRLTSYLDPFTGEASVTISDILEGEFAGGTIVHDCGVLEDINLSGKQAGLAVYRVSKAANPTLSVRVDNFSHSGCTHHNPSSAPSQVPSISPSASPSAVPSSNPSALPSAVPSQSPSTTPSLLPSHSPSVVPSEYPSDSPSATPSLSPSSSPSSQPSDAPSSIPTLSPSTFPSLQPSVLPSTAPSIYPSDSPSAIPSLSPSTLPSSQPSASPSAVPSISPSDSPSSVPSVHPTNIHSSEPSNAPSDIASATPSLSPSAVPSLHPTNIHSSQPSGAPSRFPSTQPTKAPSSHPSNAPSLSSAPTAIASASPSGMPTKSPAPTSSRSPSSSPSLTPSSAPSKAPSVSPSTNPTVQPSLATITRGEEDRCPCRRLAMFCRLRNRSLCSS